MVVVGTGQALYGRSILAYAKRNRLEQSCRDKDLDPTIKARLTRSKRKVRQALGLSKRQFGDAIHAVEGRVAGNPDMVFDPLAGHVYGARSCELVGSLLGELAWCCR